jgi:hypothetical protein
MIEAMARARPVGRCKVGSTLELEGKALMKVP